MNSDLICTIYRVFKNSVETFDKNLVIKVMKYAHNKEYEQIKVMIMDLSKCPFESLLYLTDCWYFTSCKYANANKKLKKMIWTDHALDHLVELYLWLKNTKYDIRDIKYYFKKAVCTHIVILITLSHGDNIPYFMLSDALRISPVDILNSVVHETGTHTSHTYTLNIYPEWYIDKVYECDKFLFNQLDLGIQSNRR